MGTHYVNKPPKDQPLTTRMRLRLKIIDWKYWLRPRLRDAMLLGAFLFSFVSLAATLIGLATR